MEQNYYSRQNKLAKKFRSVRKVCKENKNSTFVPRGAVRKEKLFRFNIKPDSNCVYCGESDSIDDTFIECHFTKCNGRFFLSKGTGNV